MKRYLIFAAVVLMAPTAALAQWSDNFDSYANGSQMHNQGGWRGWDGDPQWGALVTNVYARSSPHSVEIVGGGDLVQQYTTNSGQWTYTAWMYLPSGANATTYFIMLNEYNEGGAKDWAVQMPFKTDGTVGDDFRGGSQPIVYDAWAEIRLEIDLDANTLDSYYNGALLSSGTWTVGGGSNLMEIQAVDLFSNGPLAYYDDMSLVPEPATMVALGAGLALLIRRRRRKTS